MKPLLRSLTHPAIASAIVALALTVLLYGDTLSLPLFADDLIQIPWLESISWRELWTGPSPYGYYRPLWYSLWRVWGWLTGGLHPFGLHSLNLVAHFAAAWLAGLLAYEFTNIRIYESANLHISKSPHPYIPACLTTALFAAFPFSRQAVAWPGAIYNPLVSAMASGTLLAYDRGRQGRKTRWMGLALLLAALAPFMYEAGLLVGVLVVLTEGSGWLSRRWPRHSWWFLAFVPLLLVTLTIWRAMRGGGIASFGLTLLDLRRNISYLVQGLTYPTTPLARLLAEQCGLAPELCLWLVALPTLALLVWSGLRRNRDTLLLGAMWFVLFALPPLVSMEADWFALAPRFLYMTAVGVALVWTAALNEWLARWRSARHPLTAGILLAVLLTPAAVFVRNGVRLYEMTGETIWEAVEIANHAEGNHEVADCGLEMADCELVEIANHAEGNHRGLPLLLVNLPMSVTLHSRIYPLGFEGIVPLPKRVTAEEMVYVHTGIHDAARSVSFGVVATDEPSGYTYHPLGPPVGWEELARAVRQARAVYLTRYESERIHLVEAGGLSPSSKEEVLARFGDQVALLDASCTCDEAGQVHLTAHWQVETSIGTDATVFAHLLNPGGVVITQADGYPLLEMFPFWLWQPGETVRDVRHFDPVPPGEYTVRLGIWDLATGERWSASNYPDGVLLLPVSCKKTVP